MCQDRLYLRIVAQDRGCSPDVTFLSCDALSDFLVEDMRESQRITRLRFI